MFDYLFRGKRLDTGEWVEGWYLPPIEYEGQSFGASISVKNDHGSLEDVFVDPETVGLYTGMEDREGRKIFEGDLVIPEILGGEYNGYRWPIGAVVFEKGAFCIRMPRETVPLRNFAPRVSLLLAGNVYDRRDEDER